MLRTARPVAARPLADVPYAVLVTLDDQAVVVLRADQEIAPLRRTLALKFGRPGA